MAIKRDTILNSLEEANDAEHLFVHASSILNPNDRQAWVDEAFSSRIAAEIWANIRIVVAYNPESGVSISHDSAPYETTQLARDSLFFAKKLAIALLKSRNMDDLFHNLNELDNELISAFPRLSPASFRTALNMMLGIPNSSVIAMCNTIKNKLSTEAEGKTAYSHLEAWKASRGKMMSRFLPSGFTDTSLLFADEAKQTLALHYLHSKPVDKNAFQELVDKWGVDFVSSGPFWGWHAALLSASSISSSFEAIMASSKLQRSWMARTFNAVALCIPDASSKQNIHFFEHDDSHILDVGMPPMNIARSWTSAFYSTCRKSGDKVVQASLASLEHDIFTLRADPNIRKSASDNFGRTFDVVIGRIRAFVASSGINPDEKPCGPSFWKTIEGIFSDPRFDSRQAIDERLNFVLYPLLANGADASAMKSLLAPFWADRIHMARQRTRELNEFLKLNPSDSAFIAVSKAKDGENLAHGHPIWSSPMDVLARASEAFFFNRLVLAPPTLIDLAQPDYLVPKGREAIDSIAAFQRFFDVVGVRPPFEN